MVSVFFFLPLGVFAVVADFLAEGDAEEQLEDEVKPVHVHQLDTDQQEIVEKVHRRRPFDEGNT